MTQNLYDLTWADLDHDYDIVCPRCLAKASLRRTAEGGEPPEWRMVCAHCGLARTAGLVTTSIDRPGRPPLVATLPAAAPWPVDLWYSIECCGHTLRATNARHLALLKAHIGARLRGRRGPPWRNASIGSRLPRWMTSASNRQAVLRAIDALEAKG